MDYAALARQFGGTPAPAPTPPQQPNGQVDYASLAKQFGGSRTVPLSEAEVQSIAEKPEESMGFLESVGEQITGTRRMTPEIEGMDEWTKLPEINQMNMGTLKTVLGTLSTGPKETIQIIKANFPGVQVRQDSKGNYILKSQLDQKEYAIPPGLTASDVARGIGTMFSFLPAARAGKVATAGAAGATTQAAHEGVQKAVGGEFSIPDVITAGVLGSAGPIFEQYATKIAPMAKKLFRRRTEPETPKPAQPVEIPEVEEETIAFEQLGDLVKTASGTGSKAQLAKTKIADLAQINPEARQAAERLGIDVPFDVLSDNPQLRSAVGLTRSVSGSEAESLWNRQLTEAIEKADESLKNFDAVFIEGRPSTASVSDQVLASLTSTKNGLKAEAKQNYELVDKFVPEETPVELRNLKQLLEETERKVGVKSMKPAERHLLSIIEEGNPTYGTIKREKNMVGKAQAGMPSEFETLDKGTLKNIYKALAKDQLDNVERLAPPDVVKTLKGANLLTAKQKAIEERMLEGFGQKMQKSLAPLMTTAIRSGAKGDSGAFDKLMKVVPDDLKKETIATALASSASSQRAGQAGFGFNEYSKLYQGLKSNPSVMVKIKKELGPNSTEVLKDLNTLSVRMNDVRARVLSTGKANQAFVQRLESLPMIDKIMRSAMTQRAVSAFIGGAGGPIGSALIPDIVQYMANSQREPVRAAGKLFASKEFANLAMKSAEGTVDDAALNAVAKQGPFRRFARSINLPPDLEPRIEWLRSIAQATTSISETSETNPTGS